MLESKIEQQEAMGERKIFCALHLASKEKKRLGTRGDMHTGLGFVINHLWPKAGIRAWYFATLPGVGEKEGGNERTCMVNPLAREVY